MTNQAEEYKHLALIIGEVLLGVFAANLIHLRGEALVTSIMGFVAMVFILYGLIK